MSVVVTKAKFKSIKVNITILCFVGGARTSIPSSTSGQI